MESREAERDMDMSSLLELKKRRDFGYYCNCGPVRHKMIEEEDCAKKTEWTCNMVLCTPCFLRRQESMDGANQGTRRGRNRI